MVLKARALVVPFLLPIRLTIGLTLIIAGLEKLRNLTAFTAGVLHYRILPKRLGRLYGRLLPVIEICIGGLLVTGINTQFVGLISTGMFVSFAIAVGVNLYRNRLMPCFCFGTDQTYIGWHTMVRILLLIISAFLVFLIPAPESSFKLSSALLVSELIEFIPTGLLTIFGILLLMLIEIAPLVKKAWTEKAIRPENQYEAIWIRQRNEEVDLIL